MKSLKIAFAFFASIVFFNVSANAGGHYTGPDLSGQKITI